MTTPRRNHIDLHTHTARSDGVLEPLALHAQMLAWGSTLVAITDHDTLAGVRELLAASLGTETWEGGRPSGPRLIVGVEINTRVDAEVAAVGGSAERLGELHILGLGVDPADPAFEATLERQRAGRAIRLEQTLERLDELGYPVRDHLPPIEGRIDALGRPHVARALVAAGFALSVEDAFRRYLERGAVAYVPRPGLGPRAAIEAILDAGGLPVLAHAPWAPREDRVIDLLVGWGLRGLEVHYHSFDEPTVIDMARCARDRRMLATGGSDYHGDTMTYAEAQAFTQVPDEVGEQLLAALEADGRRSAGPVVAP